MVEMCGTAAAQATLLAVIFVTVFELCLITPAEGAKEEAYVTVARCRIQCLKKFLPATSHNDDNSCWDTNNHRTSFNRDCNDCWTLCKTFMTSPSLMPPVCGGSNSLCKSPCQTACSFIRIKPNAWPVQSLWKFQEKVSIDTRQTEMKIDWEAPISVPGSVEITSPTARTTPEPIVYVLLSRNSNKPMDGWEVVRTMVSRSVRIERESLSSSPEFLLMAVSEDGLIAQYEFSTEAVTLGDIEDPSGPALWKLKEAETSDWYLRTVKDLVTNMTLAKALVQTPYGSYWQQTAEVRFRGPERLDNNMEHFFSLRWFMIDCRSAYDFVPRCSLPRNDYASVVPTKGNQEASYVITNLKFNSIYLLVIYISEDYRVRAEVVFKTEPCFQPDPLQLTQCLDDIDEDSLPSVPVIRQTEPAFEPEVLKLSLNISSMTHQPNSDRVLVNITWVQVANQSADTYAVTTYMEGKNLIVSRLATSHSFIVLSLEPNTQYYVKVELAMKSHLEGGPPSHIFDEVYFNTSDVNLAAYQGLQAVRLINDEMDQVDGIIIGVTIFIIIFILAGLVTILYKKRKSFKDIIVTKATVAKSNSYKSNVGGKSDYSNQLIVFTDEWELDPLKLKFSTLLGQGAFGKVVTGYYDDQKVAIKLVREGAPVSYKEDLVAEITLMKRIGSHPNIVCLIGACTLAEPIALIMEYVPYGNLQNFLKKCRLEGDLRKSSEGLTEITYTMVQESGSMESGVVTPTDMLSFARQVAMAMEYLAEKNYVHRDLAARNVLMDYNKVVKVCDFGLSRYIVNDNHYKKTTNGKLPLKWMAIESLFDRIFTTQSDVWSFGILLWEIVTMGASPYPNVALADLLSVLDSGYRMDRPSNCSQKLYTIMRSCWEREPNERPNFTQLRYLLEDLLTEDRDYLVLDDIDVPLSNNDNSSCPSILNESDQPPDSTASVGAEGGHQMQPIALATSSANTSNSVKRPRVTSPRRDNMRINVCIHQKSTDRLIRPSESDSSPSSC